MTIYDQLALSELVEQLDLTDDAQERISYRERMVASETDLSPDDALRRAVTAELERQTSFGNAQSFFPGQLDPTFH